MNSALPGVTWIRFEKPTFDLVGVVLSSFGITGLCVAVAVTLGVCWGLVLIYRGRSRTPFEPEISLDLKAAAR